MKGKRIMGKVIVELVFILDRSGSMEGLETETIGGYNAMIEKQKKQEGKTLVTTILFNNEYQRLTFRTPIKEVRPLTGHEYFHVAGPHSLMRLGKQSTKLRLNKKKMRLIGGPQRRYLSLLLMDSRMLQHISPRRSLKR